MLCDYIHILLSSNVPLLSLNLFFVLPSPPAATPFEKMMPPLPATINSRLLLYPWWKIKRLSVVQDSFDSCCVFMFVTMPYPMQYLMTIFPILQFINYFCRLHCDVPRTL